MATLSVSREQIGDFCRRNHIKRLAFFGSVRVLAEAEPQYVAP